MALAPSPEAAPVRIRVRDVVKLFGERERDALGLLQAGEGKAEILARTGSVLGLDHVSFDVREGEILTVMGLSGSGKSTMLRCLNRLVEPTAGSIEVDGTEVTALSPKALREFRRRTFGMVFQHFALLPNRTIAENVEYGLEVQGVPKRERRDSAMRAIELVGLKGWDTKRPSQLSGGMQQRAGLARALCADAGILLMDEAFSALDPLIRRDMQRELGTLQRRLGKTVVFVSHDLDEAIHLGGRIVLMKDGAIVQAGTPEEILLAPATDYVRRFVEGIDISAVLTLGHLVRGSAPALVRDGSVAEARASAERMEGSHFVVTCDRRMPVGRVSREALSGAPSPAAPLGSIALDRMPTVPAATVLRDALPRLAEEPLGLAVVDSDGAYLGTLTNRIAVRSLAGARPAAPADAGIPMPPLPSSRSEKAAPSWTGAFPSSLSTTSAMPASSG